MSRRRRPVPISLPLAEPVPLADAIAVLSDLEAGWEGGLLEIDCDRKELRVQAFGRQGPGGVANEARDDGRLREVKAALQHHLTERSDPCQDRGVDWPCDVASALADSELSLEGVE